MDFITTESGTWSIIPRETGGFDTIRIEQLDESWSKDLEPGCWQGPGWYIFGFRDADISCGPYATLNSAKAVFEDAQPVTRLKVKTTVYLPVEEQE